MSRIAVIGTGYVGLTTGACFAHLGHDVVCADVIPEKIERLSRGDVPILEAGLDDLVREGLAAGRLSFVLGEGPAARDCEFAYLCVPTPQGADGSADLSYIRVAAEALGPVLPSESIVVNKSTVPVGSTRVVEQALGRDDVRVVSNPEFLREGSAVHDFLNPDRIVIGADDQEAAGRVARLFSALNAPVIVTDPASAETIKYASNAFLATKVSFVNAIANVCEVVGADVREVVLGMGYDKRIGFEFLKPGPGWGGSCFSGEETVLVRRGAVVRLLTFAELFEEVDRTDTEGYEVLSWRPADPSPEFLPVASFTRRHFHGNAIEVRTKLGRRIVCTPDHPFVVGDGIEPHPVGVKLASELTISDWLPLAQQAPFVVDAAQEVGHPLEVLDLGGIAEREAYVPADVPMDEDFWRMIGLYLAEGFISRDRSRLRVAWTFHPTAETDLVESVASFWRGLGVKVSIHHPPTACKVSISSRILAAWFTDVLRLGATSYEKRIPGLAWTLSVRKKQALLRGLWDGDGSWSRVNGGPSVVLEYGTVSRALADGMLRLLGDLGINARLRVGRGAKSTVDTYWLVISGADQVNGALFLLPPHERLEVLRSMMSQAKRIRPTGYRPLLKNASWVRVTGTTPVPYDGPVYSVEVPAAQTVVTTFGLVAHNCFPKDSQALVHIAEEAGYDFGLLRGVIDVNNDQFERVTDKVERLVGGSLQGRTVAVWGLTFKARTDDLRDSPSLAVIARLVRRGARVRAYDPAVRSLRPGDPDGVEVCADPYATCDGAAVLVVLTEWDAFRWLDFDKVAEALVAPRIVDARNLLDPAKLRRRGFEYVGVGR